MEKYDIECLDTVDYVLKSVVAQRNFGVKSFLGKYVENSEKSLEVT